MFIQDIFKKHNINTESVPLELIPRNSPEPLPSPIISVPAVTNGERGFWDGVTSFFSGVSLPAKSSDLEDIFKDLINSKYAQVPLQEFYGISGTYVANDFITLRDMNDVESIFGLLEDRLCDGTQRSKDFIQRFRQQNISKDPDTIKTIISATVHRCVVITFHEKMLAFKMLNSLTEFLYQKLYTADFSKQKQEDLRRDISSILEITDQYKKIHAVLDFAEKKLNPDQEEKDFLVFLRRHLNAPDHSIQYVYPGMIKDICHLFKVFYDKYVLTTDFDSNGNTIYTFQTISCNFSDISIKLKQLCPNNNFGNIEARIYAEKSIQISKASFNFPGLNLIIISPEIEALQNEININTSGALVKTNHDKKPMHGANGDKPGTKGGRGANGDHGTYGNAGGHIHLLCNQIKKTGDLKTKLIANGSIGGEGAPGGNGGNGANGEDGVDAKVSINTAVRVNGNHKLFYAYGSPGKPGGEGGKGGNGGAGGKGGVAGFVEFQSIESGTIIARETPKQAPAGKDGDSGKAGKGGLNGKPGKDHFVYCTPKYSSNATTGNRRQAPPASTSIDYETTEYVGRIEHHVFTRDLHIPLEVKTANFGPVSQQYKDENLEVRESASSMYFSKDEYAENGRQGQTAYVNIPANKRDEINIFQCLIEYQQSLSNLADFNYAIIARFLQKSVMHYKAINPYFENIYLTSMRGNALQQEAYYKQNAQQVIELIRSPSEVDKTNISAYMSVKESSLGINFRQHTNAKMELNSAARKISDFLHNNSCTTQQIEHFVKNDLQRYITGVPPVLAAYLLMKTVSLLCMHNLEVPDNFTDSFKTLPSVASRNLYKKIYLYRSLRMSDQLKLHKHIVLHANDPFNVALIDSLFTYLHSQNIALIAFDAQIFAHMPASDSIKSLIVATNEYNDNPKPELLTRILQLAVEFFTSSELIDAYEKNCITAESIILFFKALLVNCKLCKQYLSVVRVTCCEYARVSILPVSLCQQLLKELGIKASQKHPAAVLGLGDTEALKQKIIINRVSSAINQFSQTKYSKYIAQYGDEFDFITQEFKTKYLPEILADESKMSMTLKTLEMNWLMYLLENASMPKDFDQNSWGSIINKLKSTLVIGYSPNVILCLLDELTSTNYCSVVGKEIKQIAAIINSENVLYVGDILYFCFIDKETIISALVRNKILQQLIKDKTADALNYNTLAGLSYILQFYTAEIMDGSIELPTDKNNLELLYNGLSFILPDHPQLRQCQELLSASVDDVHDLIQDVKSKYGIEVKTECLQYLLRHYLNGISVARLALRDAEDAETFHHKIVRTLLSAKLNAYEIECGAVEEYINVDNKNELIDLARITANNLLAEMLVDNAGAIDVHFAALDKFSKYYAANPAGVPKDKYELVLKLFLILGDYIEAENLISALDPDRWYDELLRVALKTLLRNKYPAELDAIITISAALDQIEPQYIRLILNKIIAIDNDDPDEKSTEKEEPPLSSSLLVSIFNYLKDIPYTIDNELVFAATKLCSWERIVHCYYLENFAKFIFAGNMQQAIKLKALLEGIYTKQNEKTKGDFLVLVRMLSEHASDISANEVIGLIENIYYEAIELYDCINIVKNNPPKEYINKVKENITKHLTTERDLTVKEISDYILKQDSKMDLEPIVSVACSIIKIYTDTKQASASLDQTIWYQASTLKQLNNLRKQNHIDKNQLIQQYLSENYEKIIADLCLAYYFAEKRGLWLTQIFTLVLMTQSKDHGLLAQVKTGEGKTTIVALFAAYKALLNFKVDVTTSEVTLAIDGQKKTKTFFDSIEVSSDILNVAAKSANHYACFNSDVVYGTTAHFQNCFLASLANESNSNLYPARYQNNNKCMLVDEADSTLLDNATKMLYKPLISDDIYPLENLDINLWAAIIAMRPATEENLEKELKIIASAMCKLICDGSIYVPEHLIEFCSKQMYSWVKTFYEVKVTKQINTDFKLDIVQPAGYTETGQNRKLRIIDTDTGAIEDNMRWANGAAQALDIRYRSRYIPRSPTCDFISNYEFYRGYGNQLFGMSGTLGTQDTRKVFAKNFNLDTINVPPHRVKRFVINPSKFAFDKQQWFQLIIEEIRLKSAEHPILVVFEMLEDIEDFNVLLKNEFPAGEYTHFTHYDKDDSIEKKLTEHHGAHKKFIIVASNKGGRGTDIELNSSADKGLYVISTFVPSSSRVAEQMQGRAGRAGQLGAGCTIARVYTELVSVCLQKPNEFIEMLMLQAQAKREIEKINMIDQRIACKALEEKLAAQYRALREEIMQLDSVEALTKSYETLEKEVLIRLRRNNPREHYSLPADKRKHLLINYIEYNKILRRGLLSVLRKKWAFWFTLNNHEIQAANTEEKLNAVEQRFKSEFIEHYRAIFISNNYEKLVVSASDCTLASSGIHQSLAQVPQVTTAPFRAADAAAMHLFNEIQAESYKIYTKQKQYRIDLLEKAVQLQEATGSASLNLVKEAWDNQNRFPGDIRKYSIQHLKNAYHAISKIRLGFYQNLTVANYVKESADKTFETADHEDYYRLACKERAAVCDLHLRLLDNFVGSKVRQEHITEAMLSVVDGNNPAASDENTQAIYKKLIDAKVIYIDRIRKCWSKMAKHDRLGAENILRPRLQNIKDIIDIEQLLQMILSGERNIDKKLLQSKCISRDGLWDILQQNNAISAVQSVFLIGTEAMLEHPALAKHKEKLIQLFEQHGISYKGTGLIYCTENSTLRAALKSEENKELFDAIQSLGMPRYTRIGVFNTTAINPEVFGRYKELKINNNNGDVDVLPNVILEMAQEADSNFKSYACEEFFPFRTAEQQADTILFHLHAANILKSGGLLDKSKRAPNVLSAHLTDILIHSDPKYHLDAALVNAIAAQFSRLNHGILDLDGEITARMQNYKDIFPHREAPYELQYYFAGINLDKFLIFSVYKKPKKRGLEGAFIVALLGVIQIVVGAILVAGSGGTLALIGSYLISQGIGDLMYAAMAVKNGHFSWEEWAVHKAVSIAISIVCFSIDYYFQVLQAGSTVGQAAKSSYTVSQILMQASKDFLIGFANQLITEFAINEALGHFSQKISKLILEKIIPEVERTVKERLDEFHQKSPTTADYHHYANQLKEGMQEPLESFAADNQQLQKTRERIKQLLQAVNEKFKNLSTLQNAPGYTGAVVNTSKVILVANAIYEELKIVLEVNDLSHEVVEIVNKLGATLTGNSAIQDPLNPHITADIKATDVKQIMGFVESILRIIVSEEITFRLTPVVQTAITFICEKLQELQQESFNEKMQQEELKKLREAATKKKCADIDDQQLISDTLTELDADATAKAEIEKKKKTAKAQTKKRIDNSMAREPNTDLTPEEGGHYARGPRREDLVETKAEQPKTIYDCKNMEEMREFVNKEFNNGQTLLFSVANGPQISSLTPQEFARAVYYTKSESSVLLYPPDALDEFDSVFELKHEKKRELKDEEDRKKDAAAAKKQAKKDRNKPKSKVAEEKARRESKKSFSERLEDQNYKVTSENNFYTRLLDASTEAKGAQDAPYLFFRGKAELKDYNYDYDKEIYGPKGELSGEMGIRLLEGKAKGDYAISAVEVNLLRAAAEAKLKTDIDLTQRFMIKALEAKLGGELNLINVKGKLMTPVVCVQDHLVCAQVKVEAGVGFGAAAQAKLKWQKSDDLSIFKFKMGAAAGVGATGKVSYSMGVYFPQNNPEMLKHLKSTQQSGGPRPRYKF